MHERRTCACFCRIFSICSYLVSRRANNFVCVHTLIQDSFEALCISCVFQLHGWSSSALPLPSFCPPVRSTRLDSIAYWLIDSNEDEKTHRITERRGCRFSVHLSPFEWCVRSRWGWFTRQPFRDPVTLEITTSSLECGATAADIVHTHAEKSARRDYRFNKLWTENENKK